jgi:hypothetical protein
MSLIIFTPLLAEMGNIIFTIGVIALIVISMSLFSIIWTNFSQWAFDEFVNDKVAGAKKDRGIYRKNETKEDYSVQATAVINKRPVKPITDYDIEIVELPETFSRADLKRLEESKRAMIEDSDRYVEEHKNDYLEDKSAVDEFISGNDATTQDQETNTDSDKKSKKGKKK